MLGKNLERWLWLYINYSRNSQVKNDTHFVTSCAAPQFLFHQILQKAMAE